ncbi:MAG: hypothetical protein E7322_03495 [Clostridiales bacterium]|nr:hypothetical protein [Clostridiales bacterium]
MKPIKRIIALLLLALMALSFSACKNQKEQSIIGQWSVNEEGVLQMTGLSKEEYEQYKQKGLTQTVIMDFNNEGIVAITMSVAGQYVKDFLPYEVKDGKVIIDSDPIDYTIKGNEMIMTQDDLKLTLTRVEED